MIGEEPQSLIRWVRQRPVEVRPLFAALTGSPDGPLWAVPIWILGGVAVGKLSNEVSWPLISIVAAVIFAVYLSWQLWWRRHQRGLQLVPELVEREAPGKRGLILPLSIVSLFSNDSELLARLPEARSRLCADDPTPPTDADYELLEHSNLVSPLSSVEYHYGKGLLEDCWLITTDDLEFETAPTEYGSWYWATALERWFFRRHPEALGRVTFHKGPALRVHPRDYARLWLIVNDLFQSPNYRPEEIIVDITPGTKTMTAAIALACLDSRRSMQYLVAGRHPLTGIVLRDGRKVPMLIDVDAHLYRRERLAGSKGTTNVLKG